MPSFYVLNYQRTACFHAAGVKRKLKKSTCIFLQKKTYRFHSRKSYSLQPFYTSGRNTCSSVMLFKKGRDQDGNCMYSHVRRDVLIAPNNFNFLKSIPAGSFHYLSFFLPLHHTMKEARQNCLASEYLKRSTTYSINTPDFAAWPDWR